MSFLLQWCAVAKCPLIESVKLGIGLSIVVLMQLGHWTLGVLVNNVWSVAGSGSRPDVNQFLLQYFINYNLKKGLVHHLAAHPYCKLGSWPVGISEPFPTGAESNES